MPRQLGTAVLVVVIIASAWQGLHRGSAATGGVPTTHLATPILSARRLPVAIGDLVAARQLAAEMTSVVAAAGSAQICVDLRVGGTDVFAASPSATLLPASNIKLLTADAVLARLGAGTHLTTTVVAGAAPVNGVVAGPLYLVGGGDPLLATAALRPSQTDWTESVEPVTSLETLADRIKAAGVTSVEGIVGDDSRYDGERTVATWKASYVTSGQVSPVSALEVNSGFRISGTSHVPVADPPAAAATALAGLLATRGVRVGGPVRTGQAPPHAVPVASIDSPPMSDVVGEMLRESDNLAAEMLTKELGARFGGAGTWAAGVRVIHDTLGGAGIPLDGLVQVDGSGLDRTDRLSCRTLVSVLTAPGADGLAAGLPVAGSCGTLVKRFRNTAAAGRIRAKTGSLTGVAALSGYVVPAAAGPTCPPTGAPPAHDIAFSLLVNGVDSAAAATSIEDRVASTVSSFPQLPVLDPLAPPP